MRSVGQDAVTARITGGTPGAGQSFPNRHVLKIAMAAVSVASRRELRGVAGAIARVAPNATVDALKFGAGFLVEFAQVLFESSVVLHETLRFGVRAN